ncbi:MAG TPA: UDP-N-acetylmuramoyl-L-alanine--D-glutamate ligase [Anaerolineaceae bacterium]|nr:UDP-N-acetylmuramoyl-L-alanine--D-glutamate ligase [Anaerolineaceae bacterium]
MTNRFEGKRVLIIGAARQGLALARFLVKSGARVTLTDHQSAEQLRSSLNQLSDLPVQWVLGAHPISLLDDTDLVCVSGGVPLTLPILLEASRRGIALTNDSQIFLELVKAPVVGITGSAGKTTTTSLFGLVARHELTSPRKAWVGGNIGNPLIEVIDQIQPDDLVIQELSSFQLELMTTSPHVAVVLNITPNHLDRHTSMAEYIAAKARILDFQHAGDIAILNRDDPEAWKLRDRVHGNLVSFGWHEWETGEPQVFVAENQIVAKSGSMRSILLDTGNIHLRGSHNLMNVLAVCAIAYALNFSPESLTTAVSSFTGVKHRLQIVREHQGVTWVNDSIATAPERTLAALRSFHEPLVLLLGGRDKNLPWDELSAEIHQRVDHVIVFGESAAKILSALGEPKPGDRLQSISHTASLTDALEASLQVAKPGSVVLLSPGCTSYDAFKDFEERGEKFIEWVNAL